MITLELIQNVLFSGDGEQAEFIVKANDYLIPGDSFAEKLHYLFYTSDEKTAQLVLGPLLRKKVFTVLERGDTEHAIDIKNTFIQIAGEDEFDRCLNEFTSYSNNSQLLPIHSDFLALQQTFVTKWGQTTWRACLQAPESTSTIDLSLFSELKTKFIAQYSKATWNKIFHPDAATVEFDSIANESDTMVFERRKNAFIGRWGQPAWERAYSMIPTAQAFDSARALHEDFVRQSGQQMWNRIYNAAPIVQYFDTLKKSFITAWGLEVWQVYFSASGNALPHTPNPNIEQDFAERKHDFIDTWGFNRNPNISELFVQDFDETQRTFSERWGAETWEACVKTPNSTQAFLALQQPEAAKQEFHECRQRFLIQWGDQIWAQTQLFPIIPSEAIQIIDEFKAIFTKRWGTPLWQSYITRHSQPPCFAENAQLEVLAELFNLRLEVTPITRGIQDTTSCLHEGGDSTIHVYCRDNNHWHIDEIEATHGIIPANDRCGYTIPNGDCGYHVYVQFFWLSLRGLSPYKVIIPTDPDVFTTVQHALLTTSSSADDFIDEPAGLLDAAITTDTEGASIRSIQKGLALPTENLSHIKLGRFIQTSAGLLIRIIQAKKLPFYNRLDLLKKIVALAQPRNHTEQQVNLHDLKTILLRIANTLSIPKTKDVEAGWTLTQYQTNVEQLQQSGLNTLDSDPMYELYSAIRATNFAEQSTTERAEGGTISIQNFEPEQNDLFSATLCVAGVLMLATGITCLASMVLLILINGITPLGLTLMAVGLKSIATAISGVIGLTTPQTAVIVTVVASSMLVSCGLTLFGEYSPPSLAELDPVPSLFSVADF